MLRVREGKFGKDRLVPVSPGLAERLRRYATVLDRERDPGQAFFPKQDGGHYDKRTVYGVFRWLLREAGISHGGRGPRLHDLRHTFAVHRLEDWYRQGAAPDLSTAGGRRDAALLCLLYDTGARVQEVIDLSVRDVRLDAPAQIRLTGKGRKTRVVPLMNSTVALLREYLREHDLQRSERAAAPLFWNRRRERLTRSGVRYILKQHAERARPAQPGLPPSIPTSSGTARRCTFSKPATRWSSSRPCSATPTSGPVPFTPGPTWK